MGNMDCYICGNSIDKSEENYTYINKKEVCVCKDCLAKLEDEKENDFRLREERIIKENIENIQNYVKKSKLSIQELQLQEFMEMKDNVCKMKEDLHTIHNIILFWFIIGLISLLISIISILILFGSL